MSAYDLVLFVLVAAGAFYAGYQVGRLKALAERGQAREADDAEPLPGPLDRPMEPTRPRGSAPPASAGREDDASFRPSGSGPPRRSTKPPPAAAGLMGTGEKSQK
jgi:hypothetical protein